MAHNAAMAGFPPGLSPHSIPDMDDFEASEALAQLENVLTVPDLELISLYRILAGKYPKRRDPLGRGFANVIDLKDAVARKARAAIRERIDANRTGWHIARSTRSALRRRFQIKDRPITAATALEP